MESTVSLAAANAINQHDLQTHQDWENKRKFGKMLGGENKPTEYRTLAVVYGYAVIEGQQIWLEAHADGGILSKTGNTSGEVGLTREARNPNMQYQAKKSASKQEKGGCVTTGVSAELNAVNGAHSQLNQLITKLQVNSTPRTDRITLVHLISNN